MKIIDIIHEKYIYRRRVKILARNLMDIIPRNACVLDVGCGDGLLDWMIISVRPDITISGIDVLVRGRSHIPVAQYDGKHFPFNDSSFDVVMFIDVLHHTYDPEGLLKEAGRVSRGMIVLKDHLKRGIFAMATLTILDNVGNTRHGVESVHNYLTKNEWEKVFAVCGLSVNGWRKKLHLYPWPLSMVFDRSLHFIADLNCSRKSDGCSDV